MKVRITDNSLRFRLVQSEVRSLAAGEPVKTYVEFNSEQVLAYTLQASTSTDDVSLVLTGVHISVGVPDGWLIGWPDDDRVGFEAEVTFPSGNRVSVQIEKDFPCGHSKHGNK